MTSSEPSVPSILIVDDEPDITWALRVALQSDGYAVVITTAAAEALDLLASESFDVAFVDSVLPDCDGLKLAALIHERQPHAAVFPMSGYYYAEDPAVIEGLRAGLYKEFVAKPFDLKVIRDLISKAVNHKTEV
jgi:DNA-binding NtrC family response regulator